MMIAQIEIEICHIFGRSGWKRIPPSIKKNKQKTIALMGTITKLSKRK